MLIMKKHTYKENKRKREKKRFEMDCWMTCDCTFFSTVFQSYQDGGQMIMKGCVLWNLVLNWKDFNSSRVRTRDL